MTKVITIDEFAAKSDITRITQAIDYLNDSHKTVMQLIQCAEAMKGETGMAILDKAMELDNRIKSLIGNLQTSSALINRTVKRYQSDDHTLAAFIRG